MNYLESLLESTTIAVQDISGIPTARRFGGSVDEGGAKAALIIAVASIVQARAAPSCNNKGCQQQYFVLSKV